MLPKSVRLGGSGPPELVRSNVRSYNVCERPPTSASGIPRRRCPPSTRDHMAAARKSAKRTKKRAGKGASGRKGATVKSASKGRTSRSVKKQSRSSKKTSRSRKVRGPLTTVRTAGEKTWKALKSTTAQVVEGVRGTFGP